MASMMDTTATTTSASLADPASSVEPLLDALSSNQDHLIEGGITILQPPFSSWFLSRQTSTFVQRRLQQLQLQQQQQRNTNTHLSSSSFVFQTHHHDFPCARSYERGWTLHCIVHENLLTPDEWHEFMTVLQHNLWKFKWTQFSLLVGPVGVMAVLDLVGHMTEFVFWICVGTIFCVGIPLAAYNRYSFHKSMEYLVSEWRLKFLESNRIIEYQYQTVIQFLWGYLECTESRIVFKRQH